MSLLQNNQNAFPVLENVLKCVAFTHADNYFFFKKVRVYKIGCGSLVIRFPKDFFKGNGGLKKIRRGLLVIKKSSEVVCVENVALGIFLKKQILTDPFAIESVFAKQQTFQACAHVVKLLDSFEYTKTKAGEKRTHAIVVSKFYELGDLQVAIRKRGCLNEEEWPNLVSQLLCGVQEIHQQGYVHRDIKSGNIFLTREGGVLRVVIGDLDFAQRTNEFGKIGGTTRMFAPEYHYVIRELEKIRGDCELSIVNAIAGNNRENILNKYQKEKISLITTLFGSKYRLQALDLWSLGLTLDFLRKSLYKDCQWVSENLYPPQFWSAQNSSLSDNGGFKDKLIDFCLKKSLPPSFPVPPQQEPPFARVLREMIEGFLVIDPDRRLKIDVAIGMLSSLLPGL